MIFRVIWDIDIDANTPEEAARKALAIQRNPRSIAVIFKVAESTSDGTVNPHSHTIDLLEHCQPDEHTAHATS